jgi:hypothetical protein
MPALGDVLFLPRAVGSPSRRLIPQEHDISLDGT